MPSAPSAPDEDDEYTALSKRLENLRRP